MADSVRGRCSVIAVSDCFRLAPWADAMASQDRAWWSANPEARLFAGRKFSGVVVSDEIERYQSLSGTNSGLLACQVAVMMGATKLLLCGMDMRGSHYFGPHPAPLKNTAERRFLVFQEQFKRFRPRGVQIINCTPGSALQAYPMGKLEDHLASAVPAA